MKKYCILVSVLLVAYVYGCASLATPKAVQSDHFKTLGAGFLVSSKNKEITYNLSFEILKPFENEVFAEVQFEDPLDKQTPIIMTKTLQPEERKIIVQSRPVRGLKSYTNYRVDLFGYEDEDKSTILAQHTQYVQSMIDFKLLEGW